jgi:hypothetical protein
MNWFESAKKLLAKWKAQETESWGNFTPRAMQVIEFARKEAERLNHNFIGTEHIFAWFDQRRKRCRCQCA